MARSLLAVSGPSAQTLTTASNGSNSRRLRPIYVAAVLLIVLWAVGRDMSALRGAFVYDVFIYQCYARAFWQGADHAVAIAPETRACRPFWGRIVRPFHAFPREYPVLSLAAFSLPLLTAGVPYDAAFMWWMALLLLLATGALAWRGPPASAIALPLYTLLAGWQFMLIRYDLVPGLVALIALVLVTRGKARAATAMIAIGTLLKGFPLLLFPLFLLAWRREQGRWRVDCVALLLGLLAAMLVPAFVLNRADLLSPLTYAVHRPLQVESLPGLLLWMMRGSGHVHVVFSYGSYNVVDSAQGLFSIPSLMLLLAGLAGAYWRQWRGQDSPVRGAILILLVTLATSKVLSPQYILWLLPIAAYVEGLRLRWVLVAALGFVEYGHTALPGALAHVFPATFTYGLPSTLYVMEILARDLCLCVLAFAYLRGRGDVMDGRSVQSAVPHGVKGPGESRRPSSHCGLPHPVVDSSRHKTPLCTRDPGVIR